jgi:alpha-L-fucosidase
MSASKNPARLYAEIQLLLALVTLPLFAGGDSERETDPLVLKKLEWFQDQKFGLLLHWGPYSQWGIVESWSLCPEDEPWCARKGPHAADYQEYRKAYENLPKTFNPVKFDPEGWAAAAATAGMRYVVFTTKHHDGFCMFDTRQTDYRITSPSCPFSTDPRANIAFGLFSAFRQKGFGIGAYFSKPDWHSPDYWWPYFPPKDRNVNYAVEKYPRKWQSFREYTFRQIEELMTQFGRMDILWLDGGWVNPGNRGQDVDIPRIAAMARSHQPGLIVVDRAVPGRFENYRTPEQEIPEKPPDYVWETCMTMATSWSYVPDDVYKPAGRLIELLVDIVAKGGNFLLNIGPAPDGTLPPAALDRLAEIGRWMNVNGSAIYGTRPVPPYAEGRVRFTRGPSGVVSAILLADSSGIPQDVRISSFRPKPGTTITLLGSSADLTWEPLGKGCLVRIPEPARKSPPCRHAWSLQFTPE